MQIEYGDTVYNMYIDYVDAHSGEIRYRYYYHDPELGWVMDNKGAVFLKRRFSGIVTPEWIRDNPKPK